MLVKLHSREYAEDYGMLVNNSRHPFIYMFDHGIVQVTSHMKPVPVTRVNAIWIERDVKLHCDVADTPEKKVAGLQPYDALPDDCGLYFPYPERRDVVFHQGGVKFPLDILFLRDSRIFNVRENTRVGSKDRWHCVGCDGVIETNGGFCGKNEVQIGDAIAIFAFSLRDDRALEKERASDNLVRALLEDK